MTTPIAATPIPLIIKDEDVLRATRAIAQALNLLQGSAGDIHRAARIGELVDAGIIARDATGKLSSGKQLQDIQLSLGKISGNVNAATTGIDQLSSRISNHDGLLEIQSQKLVKLSAALDGAAGELQGLHAQADAVQELIARVTANEQGVEALAQDTTTLNADLTFAAGQLPEFAQGIAANASAIDTLDARVTANDGTISAQATRITSLETTVNDPTHGVSASASAISSLDTRVTNVEGVNNAQATSITGLTTTVNGHTATIATQQTSINGLLANYSLSLDVNGYITGFEFNNNGTTGDMTIRADKFSIVDPLATSSLIWQGGVLQALKSGRAAYMGAGFGAGYVLWAGPLPGTGFAGATDATANFYVKTNGDAYFGGVLSASRVQAQQLLAAGPNLITNATFQSNLIAAPTTAVTVLNTDVCDNWYCSFNFAPISSDAYVLLLANGAGMRCHLGNPSLTNGQVIASQVRSRANITGINAGDVFNIGFTAVQSFNGTLRTGFTAFSRMVVWFLDGTGALLLSNTLQLPRTASNVTTKTDITAPAGTTQAVVFLDTLIQNSSGATNTANTTAGTTTLQTNFTSVWMNRRADVEVAGSGQQIGDSRNLPPIVVGNAQSKVPTSPTYSAAAGAPATATISIAAFTITSGSWSLAYGAKSVGVTGTGGTTVTYFLYLDDPTYSGTGTLVATTTGLAVYQANGRIFLGTCAVTFPTSGSGSGSGTGGGGSGVNSCVTEDMFLAIGFQAGDARRGHVIDCLDLPISDQPFYRAIEALRFAEEPCVRITTDGGAVLDCSVSTPFDLLDGRVAFAPEMQGEYVITDHGIETVLSVHPLGLRKVVRISVGGVSYAAGQDATHRIFSHNTLKP